MARLKELYDKQYRGELLKDGEFKNIMEVPRIERIVINTGVGDATANSSAIDDAVEILSLISGQKPVISKAKKAVSSFKVRENMDIGVHVTLRGEKMWEFLDKLISVVFPRTTDFRGLSPKAFDGRGNYSVGIPEHTVFVEIDANKVQKLRGLQVNIVTSAKDDKSAKMLLDKFDFPFAKDGKKI